MALLLNFGTLANSENRSCVRSRIKYGVSVAAQASLGEKYASGALPPRHHQNDMMGRNIRFLKLEFEPFCAQFKYKVDDGKTK
jgi:hypothetical protein